MIKSQIFALSVILMFMPGLPDAATKTAPKTKPVTTKSVKPKKIIKAPAAFKGFSSAALNKLKTASSNVSEVNMAKKGEVAKNDSTFTWEYLLIFIVIAGGAAITLLVI